MTRIALASTIALLLSISVLAQTEPEPKVTALNMPENSPAGEITGNISSGQKIPLRWAESSQVACFPGTRFEMFNGNHVLYRVGLPAASKMKITLTPKGGSKLSLYALRQGARPADHAVPPNVRSAISCEASYPLYANVGGGRRVTNKDDGTRSVEYISVNAPYSILIGVAGAEGATEGQYSLKITVEPR
ncbi:MAG: hypothetical protein AB7Q37_11900 [Pyrinomonadaceae bacterium]